MNGCIQCMMFEYVCCRTVLEKIHAGIEMMDAAVARTERAIKQVAYIHSML